MAPINVVEQLCTSFASALHTCMERKCVTRRGQCSLDAVCVHVAHAYAPLPRPCACLLRSSDARTCEANDRACVHMAFGLAARPDAAPDAVLLED